MSRKITARTIALSLEYHLLKKDKAWLRPLVPPKVQSLLRRRARAKYLIWDGKAYQSWIARRLEERRSRYAAELEPGLLSIATPVWDGSPVKYVRVLAESIARQNANGAAEWFLLDNGCTRPELLRYLKSLAEQHPWITLHRSPKNQGIVGGLRICLENIRNRFLCVADADDVLYPDCLQIVQWWIRHAGFPPLLYSDEDKVIGTDAVQPYLKPDFDPVLLLNSAYIAHLGVVERTKALELGAYTDRHAEGSPDWDCFVRFYTAGHQAVHIPEVIYSWRMHPESTADEAGSKPYIHSSQKAVLQRYLDSSGFSETHLVRYSPLLPGSSDWWLERRPTGVVKHRIIETAADFRQLLQEQNEGDELVVLKAAGLTPQHPDYLWEAQGLFERFPDAVMVGGWISGPSGEVEDGPLVLGFTDNGGCPDTGRPAVDPGYFTGMRKQRSVSAVSARFAVVQLSFLRKAVESSGFPAKLAFEAGPFALGAWLGQSARERGYRIIFSPFLRASRSAEAPLPDAYVAPVIEPDRRYYPEPFGLDAQTAYKLAE